MKLQQKSAKSILDKNINFRQRCEYIATIRRIIVNINCFGNKFLCWLFTDIDECAESTAGCAQICHNDPGSFHCECHSGYQLGTDSKSCLGESWN